MVLPLTHTQLFALKFNWVICSCVAAVATAAVSWVSDVHCKLGNKIISVRCTALITKCPFVSLPGIGLLTETNAVQKRAERARGNEQDSNVTTANSHWRSAQYCRLMFYSMDWLLLRDEWCRMISYVSISCSVTHTHTVSETQLDILFGAVQCISLVSFFCCYFVLLFFWFNNQIRRLGRTHYTHDIRDVLTPSILFSLKKRRRNRSENAAQNFMFTLFIRSTIPLHTILFLRTKNTREETKNVVIATFWEWSEWVNVRVCVCALLSFYEYIFQW